MDKRVGLKRYELNGRKVLFYFDEVSDGGRWGGGSFLTSPASAGSQGRVSFVGICFAFLHVGVMWGCSGAYLSTFVILS